MNLPERNRLATIIRKLGWIESHTHDLLIRSQFAYIRAELMKLDAMMRPKPVTIVESEDDEAYAG